MPVGLEETFGGMKIAPDITYQNTHQFPEKNEKIVTFRRPLYKDAYYRVGDGFTVHFGRPNVSLISRPNQIYLHDLTKQSYKTLMNNGALKQPRSHQLGNEKVKPVAHLHHIPPSTLSHHTRNKLLPASGAAKGFPFLAGRKEEERWTPVSNYSPRYNQIITCINYTSTE